MLVTCTDNFFSFQPHFNPLPDNKILDFSKLKQIEDDIFKFDENSRKFSKRVENTVGKGEIARHEQFLLFPQCFQKACFLEASKGVIVWQWVNQHFPLFPQYFLPYHRQASSLEQHLICHLQKTSIQSGPKFCWVKELTHYHTMLYFDTLKIDSCGKH